MSVRTPTTGGDIGQGALVGALSAGISKGIGGFGGSIPGRITAGALTGGIVSELTGGDFAQGALQGAWTSVIAIAVDEVVKGTIAKPGVKKIPGVKVYRK